MDLFLGPKNGFTSNRSDHVQENRLVVRHAVRQIARERERMQGKEKTHISEIRKLAQQGQIKAVKTRAKDLVRQRRQVEKMRNLESQLSTLDNKIATMHATAKMAEVLKRVTETMEKINKGSSLTSLMKILAAFEKQTSIMDDKMEAIEESLDDADAEEDEETEEVVNQVLDEIGIDMQAMLQMPGSSFAVRDINSPLTKEDKQLQERLERLNLNEKPSVSP